MNNKIDETWKKESEKGKQTCGVGQKTDEKLPPSVQ